MAKIRWVPVAILLATGPFLFGLQANPFQNTTAQNKAKTSAKGKSSTPDPVVSSATLGPGTWVGLVKDSPTSNEQMVLAYHPQMTQGLPISPAQPPAQAKTPKAAAAALAKQKAAALQKLKGDWKMVRFDLTDSVPFRFFVLPEAFDDKGEILKPTAEQQDQLKKGGIPGKPQQLRPGMVVRVNQVQDGKRMLVDKVDVLKEVPLDLPGLNEKPKAGKALPKKN
ncbi:MAG: hypothetical protein ACKOS8_16830 [Gemmataceae bacterium]